MVPVHTSC